MHHVITPIVNGSMVTMDTKEIETNFGDGVSMITETNYSMNFTYSYGDEEKFFNITVGHCTVLCLY